MDTLLAAALARHTGEEKIRHLYQRLVILLAKGNAVLFLNRLPNTTNPTITTNLSIRRIIITKMILEQYYFETSLYAIVFSFEF